MKTKISVAFVFLLLIGSSVACKYFMRGESYKEITGPEMTLLVDRASDPEKRQLAQNEQARQGILKKVKEMFSIAQAAQADGLEKTDKFGKRMALATDNLLKEEEIYTSSDKGNKAPADVPKAEIDAYTAAHGKEFDEFVALATEGMKEKPPQDVIDSQKPGWAEMKIRADRARKAGLEKSPEFQLQLKMQRAAMLASAYQEKISETLKPNAQELADYYSKNPKSDPEKVKQQAEDVLKRIKGGEDFANLAKQFSDDGSATNGGLLKWFGKGGMVPEFEETSYKLGKGQLSDLVKTKFGYHIIKVEDKQTRKPKKDEGDIAANDNEQEMVLARHILFKLPQKEEVEAQLSQKKVQRALEDVTLKYPVTAPADFAINVKGIRSDDGPPPLQLPGSGGSSPAPNVPAPSAAPQKK